TPDRLRPADRTRTPRGRTLQRPRIQGRLGVYRIHGARGGVAEEGSSEPRSQNPMFVYRTELRLRRRSLRDPARLSTGLSCIGRKASPGVRGLWLKWHENAPEEVLRGVPKPLERLTAGWLEPVVGLDSDLARPLVGLV